MSVEAMAVVLHHGECTGTDKVVLLGIANHDGDGGAWPTIKTLAKYANRSRSSTQAAVRRLEAQGMIRVHVQDGGTRGLANHERPNRYELLVRCPADCDGSLSHRVGEGARSTGPGGALPTGPGGARSTGPKPPYEPPSEPSSISPELDQALPVDVPDPSGPSGRPSRRRPEVELPAEWVPLPRHVDYCRTHGLDLETERDRFRAHAAEHQRKARVWDAAFDRWLINARTYARQRPGGPPPLETAEPEHGIWNQVHGGGDNPWN